MPEKTGSDKSTPPERRRFLRESLTGSVPLLLGWLGGQVAQVARLIQQPSRGFGTPRRIAPPPAAQDSAPAPVKQQLDKHYEGFARDNPSAEDLRAGPHASDKPDSPRSFPADSSGVK